MAATIANLKTGQQGIIREFSSVAIPVKLQELGCLPGATVQLIQRAPLKDPLYININGSHIAIRQEMALRIEIDILELDGYF